MVKNKPKQDGPLLGLQQDKYNRNRNKMKPYCQLENKMRTR